MTPRQNITYDIYYKRFLKLSKNLHLQQFFAFSIYPIQYVHAKILPVLYIMCYLEKMAYILMNGDSDEQFLYSVKYVFLSNRKQF